jgi:hypothetical protein
MNRQQCPGMISLLSPEELMRADEYVRCRIGGRVRDLRLLVRDQGLVLQGHARTYYAKQLAQHAVMETLGLAIHANEIEVS